MEALFVKEGEPLVLFNLPHVTILGVIIAIIIGLVCYGNKTPHTYRPIIRYVLATLLTVNEIFWHVWIWISGKWDVKTMLPFHFCSIIVILTVIMLITRSYRLYELVYFIGVSSATQALLTPDTKAFPNVMFFQFFISHGLIVIVAAYMTVTEHFRLFFTSLIRACSIASVYAALVAWINSLLGSNYLFISRKPDIPSLLDILPAWPWYIPFMTSGIFFSMLILYLPFALSNSKRLF